MACTNKDPLNGNPYSSAGAHLRPSCGTQPMDASRRRTLLQLLFGPSMVGLRAMVTGVPASLLLAAERASGQSFNNLAAIVPARPPQFLIFSTSNDGDAINCNAPGCYDDKAITHAADPDMAATPVKLGGVTRTGAKLWANMPASFLNQTCFFHHATYTQVHPDQTKVLHVQGAINGGEILPSLIAKATASKLATLRVQPINFNNPSRGAITCDGVLQPSLSPSALASVLAVPGNGLGDADLVGLRDKTIDSLNAWAKRQAKPFQADIVDQFALSREQVRTLQQGVVTQLAAIKGNDPASQISAALVLFQMKVAPVAMVCLPFGEDNHTDTGFTKELMQHRSSIATLSTLPQLVEAAKLTGQVTFCSLNVFGRTLTGENGRGHHAGHAVSLVVGSNVKAGVVGGIGGKGSAQRAQAIDSNTGAGNDGGDVTFGETFAAYGKTLAAACGVETATIDAAMRSGKRVKGALNGEA